MRAFIALICLLVILPAAALAQGYSDGYDKGYSSSAVRGYSHQDGGGGTLILPLAIGGYPLYWNVSYDQGSVRAAYPDGGATEWYRDVAENDFLVMGTGFMTDPVAAGWGTATVDSIRQHDTTIPIVSYVNVFAAPLWWDGATSHPWMAKLWTSLETNDYFAHTVSGLYINNGGYSTQAIQMSADAADTMAWYLLQAYDASPAQQAWTGYYLDFIDWPDVNSWYISSFRDSVDYDRDSTPYGTGGSIDAGDQASYQAYCDTLLHKLEAGMAAIRPDEDFVLMANGPGTEKGHIAPLIDFAHYERTGETSTNSIARWLWMFNYGPDNLGTGRTTKSFGFFESWNDSAFYTMEAVGMIGLGAGNAWVDSTGGYGQSGRGRNSGPPVRKLTHDFGAATDTATVVDIGGNWAVAEREFENGTVRALVPTSTSNGATPWQYIILTSDDDTLSINAPADGTYFRYPYISAPANLVATAGNGQVFLNWDDNTEPDLDYYITYYSTTSGSGYIEANTVTASIDTITGLSNGTPYYFVAVAFDTSGAFSADSNEDDATPTFTMTPDAEFIADDTSIPEGATAAFTDQSTNTPTSWVWTFGVNEGYSFDQNPTHQYNTAGTFTVALAATNAGGVNVETKVGYITVQEDYLDFDSFSITSASDVSDSVSLAIVAELNRDAMIRPIFYLADTTWVEADTTGMAWLSPADTTWDGTYGTSINVAVADPDSGGLTLAWTPAEGTFDHYELAMDRANADGSWANSWATVSDTISSSDSTFVHEITGSQIPPRRGGLRYRLYAVEAGGDSSAVDISDDGDIFYNQAVGVKTIFHATKSYASYETGGADSVAVSSERMQIYATPYVDPGASAPVAAFTSDSQAEDIAQNIATIIFTDGSSEFPTSWNWDWGDSVDGTYSRGSTQNPSHDYNVAGTYSPTLWATNAAGSDDTTRTDYIVISADTTPPDTSGGLWDVPGVGWGDTIGGGHGDEPVILTFEMGGTPDEFVSIWSQYMIEGGSWVPADSNSGKGWSDPFNAASGAVYDTVFTSETAANVGSGTDLSSFKVLVRDMATTPNTIAYAQRDIYLERQEDVDTTPPDTSGVFVSVTVDSAGTGATVLTLTDMTINEASQAQFEWSYNSGTNYVGDSSWAPGTASTTVGDSIRTTVDLDDFPGASGATVPIFTRFRLRDDEGTPNVSGWNENQFLYTRADDTTPPDTSGVFVSVTVDTVATGATVLTLTDMTITGDESQAQFEWSYNSGTNYVGDSSWSPGTASTTVGDTIRTTVDIADFPGAAGTVDIYTRFRLRDNEGTPNVSGWNDNQFEYTRAADTTPPDTTGTFVSVTVDTVATGATVLTLTDMTITGDPSQVQFEWSYNSGTNYVGDSSWSPGTASTTVGDTIRTTVDIGDFPGAGSTVDIYVRYRLRDDEGTPNVSGWSEHQFEYTRASAGGADYEVTTAYIWNNSWSEDQMKVLIYDANDDLIATSDQTQSWIVGGGEWIELNFTTTVTLTPGADYRIGVVCDQYWRPAHEGTAYEGGWDDSGSFASPPTSLTHSSDSSYGEFSFYVTNAADVILLGTDTVYGNTTDSIATGAVAANTARSTCVTQ